LLALTALALDWFLTALWPIIGAAGLRHYDGILFIYAGLAIGLTALLPGLILSGRWRQLMNADTARRFLAMGFFSGTATTIYLFALHYTTPINAVILAQVEVFYSTLLSARFLGERLSRRQIIASLLVVGGTGLIVVRDFKSPRWRGDLMILLTPWMHQISHIFARKLPKNLDALTLSSGRVAFGLITLAPACAWAYWHSGTWSWEHSALRVLFAQGILMSCTNFVLWYYAIRRIDLAKATTMLLSYPALTLLLSWGLGLESLHFNQVLGMMLTLSGALWIARLTLARSDHPTLQSSL
jgi:drug/metabolite transporter (DMT)-like permease